MPAITVKNIPQELYERIRASAVTHKRSINNEIIHTLHQSLYPRRIDPEKLIARIEALQADLDLPLLTDEFLLQAKNEGRP